MKQLVTQNGKYYIRDANPYPYGPNELPSMQYQAFEAKADMEKERVYTSKELSNLCLLAFLLGGIVTLIISIIMINYYQS